MPAEKIARDCVIKKLQSSILSIWPTTQVILILFKEFFFSILKFK